ncbi:MAG: pentapeptide repeat-containing protein [Bauldia sp.]|nr:pentapeptide repeat-containing protein [Bauldia sp.]
MARIVANAERYRRAFLAAFLLVAMPSFAQDDIARRSTIREIAIGTPISALPADFQEFACGTNGGPPSLRIASFAEFAQCPPEATGLHEVQFRYNDEIHYVALAQRDFLRAELFQGTKIGNFPILGSVLIDDSGIVRGIRAVTDDRVSDRTRRAAVSMADFLRSVYGGGGWSCVDLPVGEGETPVGGALVKQDCTKLTEDGLLITTQARLLRRPGQTLINPVDGLPRAGYWESTSRVEIYQVDANGDPILGGGDAPFAGEPPAAEIPTDPLEAFLAGAVRDCPGCDLSGAQLQRRDLAGADLSDANLSGASLHRALLGGASLAGANLAGANLNLADLKRANLSGADLTDAFLYQTDAAAADLTGALLNGIAAERARFTNATMIGVEWQHSYARSVNAARANLTDAVLTGSVLVEADLQSATLAGADLSDVAFYRSRLRAVDFTGATARGTDFLETDLSDANFANADLTDARLLRARSSGLDLTDAVLTGTVMPDGSVRE